MDNLQKFNPAMLQRDIPGMARLGRDRASSPTARP
jgi:hypothetical protein